MSGSTNDRRGHGGDASHLTEDTCRCLLNGLLEREERRAALDHVASCPVCEEVFRARVIERERLRSAYTLESDADGLPTVARAGEESRQLWDGLFGRLPRPRFGLAMGIAAVLAVLLLSFLPSGTDQTDITLHWIPTASGGLQVRAAADAAEHTELAAAFEAYAERNLDRAIPLLRDSEATGHLETMRRVFLGSALARIGQHDEAVEILRSVRARTLPDPWGSEARWTLYLALNAGGHQAAADSLLRVLATERGEVGDRARRVTRPWWRRLMSN